MKIAIFYPKSIKNHNPFDTAERKIFEYLSGNYGWDITLYVDVRNNYDYASNLLKIRQVTDIPSLLNMPVRILRKIFKWLPVPTYPILLKTDELRGYDVVLTENLWNPSSLYPYFKSKKYILVDSSTRKKKINSTVIQVIKNAIGVICITKLAAEKYKDEKLLDVSNRGKIRIVGGHPIDTDLFSPPELYPADKVIRIASCGRLVYEKGFHLIIDAVSRLVSRKINFHLFVIGTGAYHDFLNKRIRSLHLNSHVTFLGNLSSEEIAETYKACHIFINHSLRTSYWEEYFGVANLEAMSSALPVITTDCGAIPWVVKDNAIVIRQGDVDALEAAMERLMADRNERILIGSRGREFVKDNYTIEIIARRYYSAITELARQ